MCGLAGRLAPLLALVLVVADGAWASDIACPHGYQAPVTVRCDASIANHAACTRRVDPQARGQLLICEYAMLHRTYQGIYADQERRVRAGTLPRANVQAWRRKRDACTTVICVDEVFAEWRRMSGQSSGRAESPSRKVKPSHERTVHAMSAPSPRQILPRAEPAPLPPPVTAPLAEPDPEPVALTEPPDGMVPAQPEDTSQIARVPEPIPAGISARMPERERAGPSPAHPVWAAWIASLLAVGGAFYWLVVRRQATKYLDAAFAALAWLHTLPPLTFILTGLALLNGMLLLILLGGWQVHLPGIN